VGGVPLKLIHGPPNSGRAGLVLGAVREALPRSPVLVVPNLDDAYRFERELCGEGGVLGAAVTTFDGLFGMVAAAAGDPLPPRLSRAQRLRAVEVAVAERRDSLGPLRRSAGRAGFAASLERLAGELQAAGIGPAEVEAGAATLEGSAYLGDLASLFASYEEVRARSGRADSHDLARAAIRLLGERGSSWGARPVFVYGVDDLTANQLELLRRLAAVAEVTVALTHEEGRETLGERSALISRLRGEIGAEEETATVPVPGHTDAPLLFELERRFAVAGAARLAAAPGEGLALLRSAGERGEAEAIAAAVGRLLRGGASPEEIAVVLRDPARRGPLLARVMESYGIGVALEAELPVASTGVGGALLALLEAELGTRRAADALRWLRGPSRARPGAVDWLERRVRRRRAQTAAEALALWEEGEGELPYDLRRLREAGPGGLLAALAETAARMAIRFLGRDREGPAPGPGDGTELQAAAAIAAALAQLAELGPLAPRGEEAIGFLRELRFRTWSGPIEGRVRIADPLRLRAGRFDHVLIGSLQDGEFPRRGGRDPFLSDAQRASLGLEPRRDEAAEERYLFYAALSLARKSLTLSYRDSDEAGAAVARSPLLEEVRALLSPAPPRSGPDPVEAALTRSRGLADAVRPPGEAPSVDELARSLAARARPEEVAARLVEVGVPAQARAEVEARIAAARAAEAATRAPGPLANPAVLAELRAVHAHGGTTLERFDSCSYRWFADHELRPQPLDPMPDAIVQGGLAHEVLERLYMERPGGDPGPRPGSLPAWLARAAGLVAELAAERGLGGRPAERAIRRGAERLLSRFLAEEAQRDPGAFEPWLLEAKFGEEEGSERPPLEIDGWRLHGAIDRVDRAPDGRALVHDYKVARSVTAARKLEEDGKLQLQLYLLAVAERWGATPVGALYHPLRGSSERRPRGLVLEGEAGLPAYGLAGTDVLPREEFDALLGEARRRAGAIVARMRGGDIRRDPGPRPGLKGHDVCPSFCDFAPICRRDRAPAGEQEREDEEP
jgi:ATP-dependent helicase/nuclease subunit B